MDLGSLNLESIESIINSMSRSDLEKLSDMASDFFSGSEENKKAPESNIPDAETLSKIASVMSRLSSQENDPACNLLAALKPMLSPKRQQKTQQAIKLLQLMAVIPYLKDMQ